MSGWTATPGELLNVFRDALLAIVPVVERAMMGWRDEEAYDDWDAIADVLYEQLVVASVRWSLAETDHAAFKMPPYNTLVESYNDLRFFAVTAPTLRAPGAFHSFSTTGTAFDTVRVRELDEYGEIVGEGVIAVPIESVQYSLATKDRTGKLSHIDRITTTV